MNFYMVYIEGRNSPTYQHDTILAARKEAVRLASMTENHDKKVYIMVPQSYCLYKSPIHWEPCNGDDISLDDIPF